MHQKVVSHTEQFEQTIKVSISNDFVACVKGNFRDYFDVVLKFASIDEVT